MKKVYVISVIIAIVVCCTMCRKPNEAALENDANFDARLSGGAATVFVATSKAFSNAIPGLNSWDERVHELGDKLFEQTFISAPAPLYGGLGPIFNNVSCASCHHNDGIGVPSIGQNNSALLIRMSIPGTDDHGGPLAVPGYGQQLQNMATFGVQPEAHVDITYATQTVTLPGDEVISMRVPTYTISSPYTAIPGGCMLSPRMAPPVFGLGLLENISETTILSFADANDANGDGISGKPNYVYNPFTNKKEIGRFGRKANTSNLLVQITAAFQQDMGITSYVFPQKSSWGQSQMNGYKGNTDVTDIADSVVNAVRFYVQSLAVPARRNVTDPTVLKGEQLFTQLQCSSCHIATMYTDVNVTLPALSHQRIHPYTDMLLHDMGDALADGRPDYEATGNEWRTPPLWGVGLYEKVNGVNGLYFLHDGRARTLKEAILWHGGEAQKARDGFARLPKADRDALIAFLKSL